MAQRLGVHRHEEWAVRCLTFDFHERKLGDGRVQRILGVCVSPSLLIVFLPNSCLKHLSEFRMEDTHFLHFFLLIMHRYGVTGFSLRESTNKSLSLSFLSFFSKKKTEP